MLYKVSAWRVLVWKNDFGRILNVSSPNFSSMWSLPFHTKISWSYIVSLRLLLITYNSEVICGKVVSIYFITLSIASLSSPWNITITIHSPCVLQRIISERSTPCCSFKSKKVIPLSSANCFTPLRKVLPKSSCSQHFSISNTLSNLPDTWKPKAFISPLSSSSISLLSSQRLLLKA